VDEIDLHVLRPEQTGVAQRRTPGRIIILQYFDFLKIGSLFAPNVFELVRRDAGPLENTKSEKRRAKKKIVSNRGRGAKSYVTTVSVYSMIRGVCAEIKVNLEHTNYHQQQSHQFLHQGGKRNNSPVQFFKLPSVGTIPNLSSNKRKRTEASITSTSSNTSDRLPGRQTKDDAVNKVDTKLMSPVFVGPKILHVAGHSSCEFFPYSAACL
jgi:hypothetical protein